MKAEGQLLTSSKNGIQFWYVNTSRTNCLRHSKAYPTSWTTSLVSTECIGDRRKITRNSSHFKKVNIDPTEYEISTENAEAPEIDIPDDTPADLENLQEKEKPVPVLAESDEARQGETTCSHNGWVIKEPRWHKDYIV